MTINYRIYVPLAIVAFAAFLVLQVSVRQALLLILGCGLGAVLARARFGFTTGWRILVENRDPAGVFGQVVLLAIGTALALPLLANFDELHGALGPLSVSLLVGAFVFGITMQIADGCGSGTLYKAGLGIPLNMGILPLFALGSFFGSVHLHSWLDLGAIEPVAIQGSIGFNGTFWLTLVVLAAIVLAVRVWVGAGKQWLSKHWLLGAVALAVLATLVLLVSGQPWGVVYGFGLWVAKATTVAGLFAPSSNPFWGAATHSQILQQSVLLDVTTLTNIGILAGALFIAGKNKAGKSELSKTQWLVGLLAGFLMGYSSRLAFGCNVGAMLSGITTGSLHGWIWVVFAFSGSLIGMKIRTYFRL